MIDLLNEILQTLRHNKLRTALTGLAVAWGIFMLIVLLSMAKGVTNSFEENMLSSGAQQITIWGGRTSIPYHGYREGRRIKLNDNDMETIEEEHRDFVDEVISVVYGNADKISTNTTYIDAGYTGVFPSILEVDGHKLISGRFINDKDMKQSAKVMVLPVEYAEQLFPPDGENAVGSRVKCAGLSFLVIGVYQGHWSRQNFIPYTTAKMLSNDKDELGSISVMLKNVSTEQDGDRAEQEIRATLSGTHNFSTDDDSAIWIFNKFSQGLKGQAAMGILEISVWILGLLTLLSGIVGISNIMFVSVRERTHEIGIRRAIGAKPRSILIQIIAEAIAITTLFGYIGIIFGTAISQLLEIAFADSDFLKNITVDLTLATEVTAVLIIAGALAGLFPALRALKVKPVEALRDE